jgi:hypothetical protein
LFCWRKFPNNFPEINFNSQQRRKCGNKRIFSGDHIRFIWEKNSFYLNRCKFFA